MADAESTVARWSGGHGHPAAAIPAGAVDCHFHIYDQRFPVTPDARLRPDDALPSDYQALQRRIGFTRGVIVQPSTYGTDNALQLAAMNTLGPDTFRMVAVVAEDVPDRELRRLHSLGVRGVRFNLTLPGPLSPVALTQLAPRLAELGWHCQLNMSAQQIEDAAPVLAGLPCTLVFDHLAQIPHPAGLACPAFATVRRLLDAGSTYVKLSGVYIQSKSGRPEYADAGLVATAFARAAPERVVWGTDWPHPTARDDDKPNDAYLVDLLARWLGDEASLRLALVDNPQRLYGFPQISAP